MNVHFIDTSVFVNIINIPFMNDQRQNIMKEMEGLLKNKDDNILLLPFATIIETGNHIAHNGNGELRRKTAKYFCDVINKTVKKQAPWYYFGKQMTEDDLVSICLVFPDMAMRKEGFRDLSIIQAFKRYKDETPAIHRIRIWSLDKHLSAYDETIEYIKTRNT